ncbi:hypothetical protein [Romboutsia sp.]|uniref:hypothetical protein n=1 Tax=Romboutsia sp. TaxID=1965302 RepID=UPI003F306144
MKKNYKTIKARVILKKEDSSNDGIEIFISNQKTKPRRKPPIETRPVRARSSRIISNLSNDKKEQSKL